ncbi:uncharacterized protein BXZ73DRAFT_82689 [Epithele typhae]|uniref:uncharacterized protein n=1 Tax=Epithele typhae TaxID=378194 RepID=UPI002008DD24|nr:uncharacterized protein BXZ73DRAFT_82689 [Epithele typhae]KAH9911619.1 hypothetical protein BXZ73DRAFT_82689 [Epithele typhae]
MPPLPSMPLLHLLVAPLPTPEAEAPDDRSAMAENRLTRNDMEWLESRFWSDDVQRLLQNSPLARLKYVVHGDPYFDDGPSPVEIGKFQAASYVLVKAYRNENVYELPAAVSDERGWFLFHTFLYTYDPWRMVGLTRVEDEVTLEEYKWLRQAAKDPIVKSSLRMPQRPRYDYRECVTCDLHAQILAASLNTSLQSLDPTEALSHLMVSWYCEEHAVSVPDRILDVKLWYFKRRMVSFSKRTLAGNTGGLHPANSDSELSISCHVPFTMISPRREDLAWLRAAIQRPDIQSLRNRPRSRFSLLLYAINDAETTEIMRAPVIRKIGSLAASARSLMRAYLEEGVDDRLQDAPLDDGLLQARLQVGLVFCFDAFDF